MSSSNNELQRRAEKVFMGTYARYPAAMINGKGCRLVDADGREYLDFLSGIAVCSLGHFHPAVTKAVKQQVDKLVHVLLLHLRRDPGRAVQARPQRPGLPRHHDRPGLQWPSVAVDHEAQAPGSDALV